MAQLSGGLKYSGKVSGLNGYLEGVRAKFSVDRGIVVKEFEGSQNKESTKK